ncbi:MAG: response regulator transcription factor [Lachnospiraceae bacterium]|nr:response regulator transcription factor [Lachnospiraceae bacterium]
MRLVVCDDVIEDAEKTKGLIKQYLEDNNSGGDIFVVSPSELLENIDDDFSYDIAVLDIDYNNDELNGIDLGKKINEKAPLCNIIYLTGVLDFASDVYETMHCYFVMKKNQDITLARALDKAIRIYHDNCKNSTLSFVCKGKDVIVLSSDIKYITRENRKIQIMSDKKYETYMSLNDCLSKLPECFSRCHMGYIVNMNYIKTIEGNKIYMADGFEAPVGRIYKESFIRHYLEFLEGRV